MSERTRSLLNLLNQTFDGSPWHGDSIMTILSNITARQATAKPIPNAHSIWDNVLHITCWKRVVLTRLMGQPCDPTNQENWPAIHDTSEEAWQQALNSLKVAHQDLVQHVSRMIPEDLKRAAPGQTFDNEYMLNGLIHHDLYHLGQITLLKKAD